MQPVDMVNVLFTDFHYIGVFAGISKKKAGNAGSWAIRLFWWHYLYPCAHCLSVPYCWIPWWATLTAAATRFPTQLLLLSSPSVVCTDRGGQSAWSQHHHRESLADIQPLVRTCTHIQKYTYALWAKIRGHIFLCFRMVPTSVERLRENQGVLERVLRGNIKMERILKRPESGASEQGSTRDKDIGME